MMIPMGAIFAVWFVLTMVWHGVYRHFMNVSGYDSASPMTRTIVDIGKQIVPISTFIFLGLSDYVLSWFGVVA